MVAAETFLSSVTELIWVLASHLTLRHSIQETSHDV